jgi:hypothetical protein
MGLIFLSQSLFYSLCRLFCTDCIRDFLNLDVDLFSSSDVLFLFNDSASLWTFLFSPFRFCRQLGFDVGGSTPRFHPYAGQFTRLWSVVFYLVKFHLDL